MGGYKFKIGEDGLTKSWILLRLGDVTVLTRGLIDTGANILAVSSAIASALRLPSLGREETGTAAGSA